MDFAFSDEQRALGESVRSFLRDRFGPEQVRAVYEDPSGDGDPAELRKAAAESGWLAVLVPEAHDGLGLGLLDAAVVAREFGAGVTPGSWLSSVIFGEAVRLGGSPAQSGELLPQLAAGELVGTVALRGDGGSWSPEGIGVRVAADGTLHGVAAGVEYAHVAQYLAVAATGPDGVGLHLVPTSAAGLTVTRQDGLDRTTRLSRVTFDGVAADPLGDAQAYTELVERATALVANDLAGTARTALSATVDYLKVRQQFGRPVGSFQTLKHALADLHVAVTMAEHAALYAPHALDAGLPDALQAVSVAKIKASTVGLDATRAMVQYHGGIGFTWEHDTHFYFKRAQRLAYTYNSPQWHAERLASLWLAGLPG